MDKQTIIKNILTIYSKFGITQEDIEPLIDESVKEGRSYDSIFFFLQLALTDVCGLDFFWCTSRQMGRALGRTDEEIEEIASKKAKIAGISSPNGSYIQELTKQKEEYEQKLTADSEYITAPEAGVVSYRVDGLEAALTPDDFSNLTEEKLENLQLKTGKIVSTSNETRKDN